MPRADASSTRRLSPASTRTHAAGYENDPWWGIIQSRHLSVRATDGRWRGIARGLYWRALLSLGSPTRRCWTSATIPAGGLLCLHRQAALRTSDGQVIRRMACGSAVSRTRWISTFDHLRRTSGLMGITASYMDAFPLRARAPSPFAPSTRSWASSSVLTPSPIFAAEKNIT